MNIKEFAQNHSLRFKRDANGDVIVIGRYSAKDMPKQPEYQSHVYDGFDDGKLGVYLGFTSARKLGNTSRALLAAGCSTKQSGHTEGCFKFDPADETQVAAVIAAAGLKKRRILSEDAKQLMRDRLALTFPRQKQGVEGHFSLDPSALAPLPQPEAV